MQVVQLASKNVGNSMHRTLLLNLTFVVLSFKYSTTDALLLIVPQLEISLLAFKLQADVLHKNLNKMAVLMMTRFTLNLHARLNI